ncbi:MAG TPA: IS481 family transposase [Thermoanaerobaculia bacterium]|jgi:transposase InsO family protein|nr:IS481 family transposase [Thermoanaerobaculia bacterium]
MPWQERDRMSLREEFVVLASREGAKVRDLCRRYGISPKTGYKWLSRYQQAGSAGLEDRSRRPHHSPKQTSPQVEEAVLAVRRQNPWGGRKIRDRLLAQGEDSVPPASTITGILRRHGCLVAQESEKHQAWARFEQAAPNEMWQMDFKELPGKGQALTSLDDHSRFALILQACPNKKTATVRDQLIAAFRRYGLPRSVLVDNGPPWGTGGAAHPYTALTVWLIRLGIRPIHSRPYHPQTLGKQERFHRTLEFEVLRGYPCETLEQYQHRFDAWRHVYNFDRPHQALAGQVPARRYQPSQRSYPEQLPLLEYGPEDIVRKVRDGGRMNFRGRTLRISQAFDGYPVAIRATARDGQFEVYFAHQRIASLDLGTQVSE